MSPSQSPDKQKKYDEGQYYFDEQLKVQSPHNEYFSATILHLDNLNNFLSKKLELNKKKESFDRDRDQ